MYLEKYDHVLKNPVLPKTNEEEDISYLQKQLEPLSNSFSTSRKKTNRKNDGTRRSRIFLLCSN